MVRQVAGSLPSRAAKQSHSPAVNHNQLPGWNCLSSQGKSHTRPIGMPRLAWFSRALSPPAVIHLYFLFSPLYDLHAFACSTWPLSSEERRVGKASRAYTL